MMVPSFCPRSANFLLFSSIDQWDAFFSRFASQGGNLAPAPQNPQQAAPSSPHNLPPRFAT